MPSTRLHSTLLTLSLAIVITAPAAALASDPPAPGTWLQRDARSQLQRGMQPAEVEKILGKPTRTRFTNSMGGSITEFEYRSGDLKDWMIVRFMAGKMSNYDIARLGQPESAGPKASQRWRTQAAWQELRPDMPLTEVERILGKPTAKSLAARPDGSEAVTAWLYDMNPAGTDPATGMVMVLNDKVLAITSPLFPAE